jgi:hypothetical protein
MWFGDLGGEKRMLNPDEICTERNLNRGRSDSILLLFDGVQDRDARVQVYLWADK